MQSLEDRITKRLRAPDYAQWRSKVEATGGCAHPVRLTGEWTVLDARSAEVLASRSGHIFAPCGNRRASVCPACSDRYAADAFHLIRAGVSGGSKGVPIEVREHPRVFATLTAPSFGPVHGRRSTPNGKAIPCRCGEYHHPDDPRLGSPLDPDSYDYAGSVIWQANSGALWHRFVIALRRALAHAVGVTVREFKKHAAVSYAKVAEYQRRGLVHFHAVIRIDGPGGPASIPPPWATPDLLTDAIRTAARSVSLPTVTPSGPTDLRWGTQVDVRRIEPAAAPQVEDEHGQITEDRLAAYVAKYATKGTGKTTDAADRRIRSQLDIDHLVVTKHHRRIIQTCWDLGDRPEYERLNLRRWAHMLGFRGHFLSKSRRYSTTFGAIRTERATYRAEQALDRLGVTFDTVTVVNTWDFTGTGYRSDAERELAAAIAERLRAGRKLGFGTGGAPPDGESPGFSGG